MRCTSGRIAQRKAILSVESTQTLSDYPPPQKKSSILLFRTPNPPKILLRVYYVRYAIKYKILKMLQFGSQATNLILHLKIGSVLTVDHDLSSTNLPLFTNGLVDHSIIAVVN